MNLRRHKPGSWRLTWELGRDPATGKRLRETRVVTGTKAEAARIWRERQAAIEADAARRARMAQDPAYRPLRMLFDQWLAEAVQPHRSPSTTELYTYVVRRWLAPTLGATRLADLTPETFTTVLATWRETPRQGSGEPRGVSPTTIRIAWQVLRTAVRWAWRQGWIRDDPMARVSGPPVGLPPERWWTPAQARQFLAGTADDWYGAVWALGLLGGLRIGEILGLRWADIDLEQGVIWIRQVRGRTSFGPPKTARSRRPVALDDALRAVLDQQAARQAAYRARLGRDWPAADLVITTHTGTPANRRNVARAFAAACDRVGVPRIRLHDLRHTHATLLRQAGADWKVIADRLGHSSPTITARVYLHADLRDQADAAARVSQRILAEGTQEGTRPR